ncbi:MAG: fluoride efflux transporter CrcB [Chloroflexota bacterium]|nr:fluoride efflux transporter CrcB [Chloroflexota bacterium]
MTLSTLALAGLIGLAGALGALARYSLGRFIAERTGAQFPLGTLLINVTGALVIGLLFALSGRHVLTSVMQSIFATGFRGGYTTFSTMSWEAVQLARGGSTSRSLLYLGGNVALGLCAVVLGLMLGWWL